MKRTSFDYSKLIGKMAEMCYTRKELSDSIGITLQSLSRKLNNLSPFYLDEIYNICQVLGIELGDVENYFFIPKV